MLKGKVALITGASKGVGAAVAKRYAKEGAHVILLGRGLKKLEMVDDIIKVFGGESTIINMDLTEFDRIPALAASISARFEKLDILVCNASIMGDLCLLSDCAEEMWCTAFDINLHANWQLIKNFDSLLKLSNAGRAIFVTFDVVDMKNLSFWGPHAISKSALESMVRIYAAETRHTNIKANLVSPGAIASDIYKKAYPGQDLSLIAQPDDIIDVFLRLASEDCKFTGRMHHAQY